MNKFSNIKNLALTHKNEITESFFKLTLLTQPSLKKLKYYELRALLFLSIENTNDLIRLLSTSRFSLEKLINNPEYRVFSINKKKSGKREINAPEKNLKTIQQKLNSWLQAYYLWIKPPEVFGFVINPYSGLKKSCNIRDNAQVHVGSRHILNLDLKDFFPSIAAWQVKELFVSPVFGFDQQVADILTLLTTFNGKLPTGAPSSPVISNFICLQLDESLMQFALENGLKYSRYADDLTFSSQQYITTDHLLDIISLIRENGFRVNQKKLRLVSNQKKQIVTGVVVNQKVNVDRKLLKKIRAMLYDLTAHGVAYAAGKHFKTKEIISDQDKIHFMNRLNGYINFVGQIRGTDDIYYRKFKEKLNKYFLGVERVCKKVISNR